MQKRIVQVLQKVTPICQVSQDHVWPEEEIMPNTVLVGRINLRVNEVEILSSFKLYNTVYCEVKLLTELVFLKGMDLYLSWAMWMLKK